MIHRSSKTSFQAKGSIKPGEGSPKRRPREGSAVFTPPGRLSSAAPPKPVRRPVTLSPEQFSQTAKELLIPDAQGEVNSEEFRFAVMCHLLKGRSESTYDSFLRNFNDAVSVCERAPSYDEALNFALEALPEREALGQSEAKAVLALSSALTDPTASNSLNNGLPETLNIHDAISRGRDGLAALARSDPAAEMEANLLQEAQAACIDSGAHRLVLSITAPAETGVLGADLYSALPPRPSALVEQGQAVGEQNDSTRLSFGFSREAKDYPSELYLVVKLLNGGRIQFKVNEKQEATSGP